MQKLHSPSYTITGFSSLDTILYVHNFGFLPKVSYYGTLTPILLYHVLSGYIPAAKVTAGYFPTLSSAFGKNVVVQIATTNGVMLNNSSKVIATDVVATNGIIHVIDQVLLPPTVVDLALQNSIFSTLVLAVVKADLATALSGAGPFTVFAPTNDAFSALFAGGRA